MTAKRYHYIPTILLIIVIGVSLLNVQLARAQGETPTEPPAATEVVTDPALPVEPPVEATPEPGEPAPASEETAASVAPEPLSELPADTNIVVLDEGGNAVPLAAEEAAEIIAESDPMWCPAGVLPGGPGCSAGYATINELISDMVSNTASYQSNGVIYFTATAGGPLALTTSTLTGGDFAALSGYDLTLQGGWNGSALSPAFSGQTDFMSSPIVIGTNSNRWAGNITLNDIVFNGVSSATALTIFTTTGDITLNNVDVLEQGGGFNTALLYSNSGDIAIEDGSTFDGNGSYSNGLGATAGTGAITISDSSITDAARADNTVYYDGARLTAPTVTLTNVLATGNNGNGLRIDGASVVTLNNVVASSNGAAGYGSGVYATGLSGSRLIVIGGTFNNNGRVGIRAWGPTIYVQSAPTCEGNARGCYGGIPIFDGTAPVITPTVSGTAGPNGWYSSDVSVSWSVVEAESEIFSQSGCTSSTLTGETTGTTLTCSATNKAGLTSSVSVAIKIDKTAPDLSLPANITQEATGPVGAVVNYAAAATDMADGSLSVSCSPHSGSVFPLGITTVNCSATDLTAHTSSASFTVTVQDTTAPRIAAHADVQVSARSKSGSPASYTNPSMLDLVDGGGITLCSPASGSFFPMGTTRVTCTGTDAAGNTASSTFSVIVDQPKDSSVIPTSGTEPVVPLVGGELIDLDCDSVLWAFGVKLSFTNLCSQQTIVHQAETGDLPSPLPDGFSFVMGLTLDILTNGEIQAKLPEDSTIEMEIPISDGSPEFAVLHWSGTAWTEISVENSNRMISLSTEEAGTFILVKK